MINVVRNCSFKKAVLEPWAANQHVIVDNSKPGCVVVKRNQPASTPGILQKVNVQPNCAYVIMFDVKVASPAFVWVGDESKKETVARFDIAPGTDGEIICRFHSANHSCLHVGVLHWNGKIGDAFTLRRAVMHRDGENTSPYSKLQSSSFWRPSVAERHFLELTELAAPVRVGEGEKVGTAGSCFAQHISRHLRMRGESFLDLEPTPDFVETQDAQRFGFGLYSCRYGNVYTARQLLQLMQESLGERKPAEVVWAKDGRFYDALRPSVDPVGHDTEDDVLALRKAHLEKVAELWRNVDLFVFTLGLTEAWVLKQDGTVFPTAPGTICGAFDAERYEFHNFRYNEIHADLMEFWNRLKSINPKARMLLTVSPVPLTATATNEHVLVATMQSKATLRAVAGDLAATVEGISYFPSYEIISTHPSRGMFFNPDLRTVNSAGVEYVMKHFFGGVSSVVTELPKQEIALKKPLLEKHNNTQTGGSDFLELVCDEEELDKFAE